MNDQEVINTVFGEHLNVVKDDLLDRRIYNEIVYKIVKFQETLGKGETVGMRFGDIIVDVQEFILIPKSGFVMISGIRLISAEAPRQSDGVFLSVHPLYPLSLTLLSVPVADSSAPRKLPGFSRFDKEPSQG